MILFWPEIKYQFNFTLFQTMKHSSNEGKTESQEASPQWGIGGGLDKMSLFHKPLIWREVFKLFKFYV